MPRFPQENSECPVHPVPVLSKSSLSAKYEMMNLAKGLKIYRCFLPSVTKCQQMQIMSRSRREERMSREEGCLPQAGG